MGIKLSFLFLILSFLFNFSQLETVEFPPNISLHEAVQSQVGENLNLLDFKHFSSIIQQKPQERWFVVISGLYCPHSKKFLETINNFAPNLLKDKISVGVVSSFEIPFVAKELEVTPFGEYPVPHLIYVSETGEMTRVPGNPEKWDFNFLKSFSKEGWKQEQIVHFGKKSLIETILNESEKFIEEFHTYVLAGFFIYGIILGAFL